MIARRTWAACRLRKSGMSRPLGWLAAALSAAIGAIVLSTASGPAQAGVAVSLTAFNDSGLLSGLTLVLAFLGAGVAAVAFHASNGPWE